MQLVFAIAKFYAPTVIFFDEIDSIAGKRKENAQDYENRVKNILLTQLDGIKQQEKGKYIFVIATTNRPNCIDAAIRRRLTVRIYIPLPGDEGRR